MKLTRDHDGRKITMSTRSTTWTFAVRRHPVSDFEFELQFMREHIAEAPDRTRRLVAGKDLLQFIEGSIKAGKVNPRHRRDRAALRDAAATVGAAFEADLGAVFEADLVAQHLLGKWQRGEVV